MNINPILIYLIELSQIFNMIFSILGLFIFIVSIFGLMITLSEGNANFSTKFLISSMIGSIFLLIAVIIPNRDVCYNILAVSLSETNTAEDIELKRIEIEKIFNKKENN